MGDYEFPRAPQVEQAYRAAHRALEDLCTPGLFEPEEDLKNITDVISQFPTMIRNAESAVAAQFGPLISWEEPRRDGDWQLIASGVDLDNHAHDFDDLTLSESAFEGVGGEWHGGALDRAARAYSRQAGWDFAPDESGIWLLMLAPVHGSGGESGPWGYTGHLTGFVIVHDRDHDGAYESVAHLWTAAAWRRRGIARRLLAEATARFPITGVEGPYTADGAAFLKACPITPDAAAR